MKIMNVKTKLSIIGITALMFLATQADAIPITTIDGIWTNQQPGSIVIAGDGKSLEWGTPTSGTNKSGYTWADSITPFNAPTDGTPFILGNFTHNNYPITGTSLTSIDLVVDIVGQGFSLDDVTFSLTHNETPNSNDALASRDIVTIDNPVVNANFNVGGIDYFFNLIGFSQDNGNTITEEFKTFEKKDNTATLFAQITTDPVNPIPEPATMLLFGAGIAGLAAVRRRKS